MSFPSPSQWRSFALTARQTAEQYRLDAPSMNEPYRSQWVARADQCDDRADFYDWNAELEEWRINRNTQFKEHRNDNLATN